MAASWPRADQLDRAGFWLALAFCCAQVGEARAAATGLSTIPTADQIPWRTMTLQIQNNNTSLDEDPVITSQPQPVAQIQFGLPARLEAGLDFVPVDAPGDYRPQLNLKWQILAEGDARPAIAAGVAQVGSGVRVSEYFVLTRTLNYEKYRYQIFRAHHRNIKLRGHRVHAGAIRQGGRTFALAGADLELSDRWLVTADWISSSRNALSVGATLIVSETSSFAVALLRGNATQRLDGALLTFTRTFKW